MRWLERQRESMTKAWMLVMLVLRMACGVSAQEEGVAGGGHFGQTQNNFQGVADGDKRVIAYCARTRFANKSSESD